MFQSFLDLWTQLRDGSGLFNCWLRSLTVGEVNLVDFLFLILRVGWFVFNVASLTAQLVTH